MKDWEKEYEEQQREYGEECKKRLKDDPKFPLVVTPEQAIIILEPYDAPENFYCDGEITPEEALRSWKQRLKNSGLNPTHVGWITKYVFG
jgi:hypothetical protein